MFIRVRNGECEERLLLFVVVCEDAGGYGEFVDYWDVFVGYSFGRFWSEGRGIEIEA